MKTQRPVRAMGQQALIQVKSLVHQNCNTGHKSYGLEETSITSGFDRRLSLRTFVPLALVALLIVQSNLTHAADLDGAWMIDTGSCAQVFTKKNNKIAFTQDADLNAGGLIIQGKQIAGTMGKCTVKSLHDDGSTMKLIAACSDGVMVSDVAYDVKISGQNNMTLSQKEPVPVEMRYVRCQL